MKTRLMSFFSAEKLKEEIDMLKSFTGKTRLCNVLCALLTLCLMVLQFTPFWHYGSESKSINGYVWLDCQNSEIASWFTSQLGSAVNINSLVITAVLVLLLGVGGIILCFYKSDVGLVALLPAASSLCALYAFAFKPAFRLGSTWITQLILCIAILIFAVMAVVYGFKKNDQEALGKKALTQGDIDARVNAIRALGNTETKKGRKVKTTDSDSNFHKLLTFLTDEVPECRAAAAEALGKTSRDVAVTHITHLLNSEKDERVIQAMRAALRSIRENMKAEHAARA